MQNKKKLNILYVEDEKDLLKSMSSILSLIYGHVYPCENGKVGLEEFITNKDDIDLILTDVRMPVMSGIEMLKEIRKINSKIPIYVVSADIKLQNEIMSLGAKRFFQKPLVLPDLVKKIEIDILK